MSARPSPSDLPLAVRRQMFARLFRGLAERVAADAARAESIRALAAVLVAAPRCGGRGGATTGPCAYAARWGVVAGERAA